ncbi:MAG: alpha/beta fold hydrolase [Chloroflexi bacterium]|nr:alpha/beta fold hydrolase [Chloroflexota bacterium]
MSLEVLSRPAQGTPKSTPLLFVHGAWHGAWCWDEYWMPYFAQQGYPCYALSLRGHGGSPAVKPMFLNSINDYVQDVATIAARIKDETGQPPALIGHSMGGFITQKYLEKYDAPAGVLLASIPIHGALPFFLRLAVTQPLATLKSLFTLTLYSYVASPELARRHFFSADVPQSDIQRYFARLGNESWRMAFDVLLLNLPRPKKIMTPLLVVAAANDQVFMPWEEKRTAQAYHTEALMLPDTAHDVMLETRWQAAADQILAWLAQRGL